MASWWRLGADWPHLLWSHAGTTGNGQHTDGGPRCGARYVNSRVLLLRCLYIYEGGCFVSARYTESILDRGELLTYIGCCVRVFTVCMYLLIIIYVVSASRRQKLEVQSN